MSTVKEVWVLAEKQEAFAELCAGGRTLGAKLSAIIIGPKNNAEKAILMGADQVYWLGELDASKMLEDYTPTIYNLLAAKQPDALLISSSKRGKLIAGRLAAKLGTSVLTDAKEIVAEGGRLQTKRMVYGGAANRTEKSVSKVVIITIGAGVYPAAVEDAGHQGTIDPVAFVEAEQRVKRLETRIKKGGTSVNLPAAKRVVAVGRGIAKQEDLKMIEEFAGLIEAEVGCSRPLAEGVNWFPRERYIGVSGAMLKPELYIAIGISGQIQHMVGCNQARTIFAINKDKAAPIFTQTDYGVAGDLYKLIPALIEKLKAGK